MTTIRHEVNVRAAPARVYEALRTAEALGGWHGAAVERAGADWTLRYRDGPTFRWKVSAETPGRVAWTCIEGPGDAPGTTATFTLAPLPDGRTRVEFEHAGWPHSGGNFHKCNTLWGMLLHRLAQHAAAPAGREAAR